MSTSAPAPAPPPASPTGRHPFLELLATLLAPLFLAVSGGDPARAHSLARDAIIDLRPTTFAQLLLAAQTIGFSLAALSALGQSATPGLPEQQVNRLRAQADRLGRSALRCQTCAQPANPRPRPRAPQPRPPSPSAADWAAAMQDVAKEFAAEPGGASGINAIQAAALRSAAQALGQDPLGQHPHQPPRR